MLADLEDVGVDLAALDASAHGFSASVKLRALPDEEFASAAVLIASAVRKTAGLRRLSPARWLARRKLRKSYRWYGEGRGRDG